MLRLASEDENSNSNSIPVVVDVVAVVVKMAKRSNLAYIDPSFAVSAWATEHLRDEGKDGPQAPNLMQCDPTGLHEDWLQLENMPVEVWVGFAGLRVYHLPVQVNRLRSMVEWSGRLQALSSTSIVTVDGLRFDEDSS